MRQGRRNCVMLCERHTGIDLHSIPCTVSHEPAGCCMCISICACTSKCWHRSQFRKQQTQERLLCTVVHKPTPSATTGGGGRPWTTPHFGNEIVMPGGSMNSSCTNRTGEHVSSFPHARVAFRDMPRSRWHKSLLPC